MKRVVLDGGVLPLEQVRQVARGEARVSLGARAVRLMRDSRAVVEAALSAGVPSYGVNTGFGHLADVRIPPDRLDQLQYNLLRSHAAGVGPPLSPEQTRAVMLLRAHALAGGRSGVRPELVRGLVRMLNAGVLPRIPRQGSVGASGDLAPLAHLALALVGEGEVLRNGRFVPARAGLRASGLRPVRLEAKEGLSLINGTQFSTALATLALLEAEGLLIVSDIAGAMSVEALKGSAGPFDERIHRARPHPGQLACAANMRALLSGSEIIASHRDCDRIQDSYALRCVPQVHGVARGAALHVRGILEVEVNSSTDNPLVFAPRRGARGSGIMISGGNFHGQPVASALDYLALAIASLASISERRVERLVNPQLSGLPAFLAQDAGLNSGLMLAQVTAAALTSENKVLSHPASVDSIPTSANREDHVSMAPIAARKAAQVIVNTRRVLAIEILAAAQALDFLKPLRPAPAIEKVHRKIRRRVSFMRTDRVLAPDIAAVEEMILSGELRAAAESAAGPLA